MTINEQTITPDSIITIAIGRRVLVTCTGCGEKGYVEWPDSLPYPKNPKCGPCGSKAKLEVSTRP